MIIDNKDAWAAIRMFLKYLYKESIVGYDYSTIVPHYTRPFIIPTTYSEDEILKVENAIDRSSKIGISDYAMLLLATRLGMRSGDIAGLAFDEIDFEGNSIHLVQEKTLQMLELPLLPEIKDAIMNYIENARPTVNDEYRIFLRQNAPYQGITTSAIRFATTKYFRKAGIDISDKKHGLHTFRSSLASSMVNDQVPYDVVRKVLGHTDPNAIKHYAKVDIERLREYAIAVPAPSGVFEAFLKGGRSYAGL
ncbi:site-specific recombinase XerD [Neobacillus niacini]|nr:site-specific recombinase XerD [Neobacillus niacini]